PRSSEVSSGRNRRCILPFHNVLRCIEDRINPPAPWFSETVYRWKLEVEWLPIGVQDQVEEQFFFSNLRTECQAMRIIAPVRLVEFYAMPSLIRPLDQLVQTLAFTLRARLSQQTPLDEQSHEPMYIRMFVNQSPVQPTDLVVLTVGVVVA